MVDCGGFCGYPAAISGSAVEPMDSTALVLNPWRGISILTPSGFVSQFAA